MSNFFRNLAKSSAEKVYKIFGQNSGGMLLATSILGLTFSAAAQILGICVNKKYTTSQKAFMIPQELGELIVSSAAIFAITRPTQRLVSNLVKTGKILPKELVLYMKENNLSQMRGRTDFDFGKEVHKIIDKIEKSDNYTKMNSAARENMLQVHKKALDTYEITSDAAVAIGTTAASAITVGTAVPIIRNKFASYYHQRNIGMINYYKEQVSGNRTKI